MDVELADQIISLTANGPSPNQLLLDLLDHSIASQVNTFLTKGHFENRLD